MLYIQNLNKKFIKKVEIFDIYLGDKLESNQKSLAFRLTIQSDNQTLTEEMINEISDNIISKVTRNFNAILRST